MCVVAKNVVAIPAFEVIMAATVWVISVTGEAERVITGVEPWVGLKLPGEVTRRVVRMAKIAIPIIANNTSKGVVLEVLFWFI